MYINTKFVFYMYLGKANDSSSSCESDDELNAYNSHFSMDSRLFFENNDGNAFSVYRCLLTNKKVKIIFISISNSHF